MISEQGSGQLRLPGWGTGRANATQGDQFYLTGEAQWQASGSHCRFWSSDFREDRYAFEELFFACRI